MKKFCTKTMACVLGASMMISSSALATPEWTADSVYTAGNQVCYDGSTYEAQWWTQNEKPGSDAWGAWKKISNENADNTGDRDTGSTPNEADIPQWDSATVYTGGKQAVYSNTVYEALWWVQGEIPSQSAAWKEVGAIEATDPAETDKPTETEENEAPVLTGVQASITVTVGDAFDALNGIAATDKEDGDLTKSIVISGSVDMEKAGTYELIYSVEDSKGLTASATCKVIVKEAETVTPPLQIRIRLHHLTHSGWIIRIIPQRIQWYITKERFIPTNGIPTQE